MATCKECGKGLDEENRSRRYNCHRKDGSKQMKNLCRPCEYDLVKIVKDLEKKHPRPPAGTPCECCGRVSKLHLDHEHGGARRFRGYICAECNTGIGKLGDSKQGVLKALTYLLGMHMPMKVNVKGSAPRSRGEDGSSDSESSSVSCEEAWLATE